MLIFQITSYIHMLILTGGDEETVAEPGLEEPIFGGFVDVDLAGQNDLDVARVH